MIAPPEAFEELTGGKVSPRERLVRVSSGKNKYVTYLDIADKPGGNKQPVDLGVGYASKALSKSIDGVVLEPPRQCYGIFPSPIPPATAKFHLRLPTDVATGLNAQPAWRPDFLDGDDRDDFRDYKGARSFNGKGVLIAMPDTGWVPSPLFHR